MAKFKTKDKSLFTAQAEDLGKIRVRDVRRAIASAEKQLKPLLEARKQRISRNPEL